MNRLNTIKLGLAFLSIALINGCTPKEEQYYKFSDFEKIQKIDVHFHFTKISPEFMQYTKQDKFMFLSPNPDLGDLERLDREFAATDAMYHQYPDRVAHFTAFYATDFEKSGFADEAIARIKDHVNAGAVGVKIWKNIGMVIKDKEGKYILPDHPALDPIYSFLEENNIPLMAHIGEPKDCWLPLEEMEAPNNRNYYQHNPQYYAYLLPEIPSYEEQIRARDNIMKKHPNLSFIGAHLGSEEWSVDKLAASMDAYPNMKVDMSARILNLQAQSIKEYDKVRNFLIKYADRIMYGSDYLVSPRDSIISEKYQQVKKQWEDHWVYYATDSIFDSRNFNCEIKGLHLPKEVIDKIYYQNASIYFK